jgi:hypothetical protein
MQRAVGYDNTKNSKHPETILVLDAKTCNFKAMALRSVPFSSVFFCSKPMVAALTWRRTQLYMLLVGCGMVPGALNFPHNTQSHAVRFTAMALRNASLLVSSPGIANFGLLLDGHPLSNIAFSVQVHGSSMTITAKSKEEPMQWNGWYFTTSETELPDTDPVRFQLHSLGKPVNSASDEPADWTVVGSSSLIHHRDLGTTTLFHGEYPTSLERGHIEVRALALEKATF